ncbi:MAG: primosomal protein N' [Anaerolineae bacterium]|nr:primosomal protein N' [Anaerolineae bacterium]
MTVYVEIAVHVPNVSGSFHYHLPPSLEGHVGCGHLVTVPFGKQTVQGVVLRTMDRPEVPKTRQVAAILDPEPVVTAIQIQLAHAMMRHSFAPLSACIALMLPPGLGKMADTLYQLTVPGKNISDEKKGEFSEAQLRLWDLLNSRGSLRGRQIERALPRKRWRDTARALERRGYIFSKAVLQAPSVRPKTVRTAQLACSPSHAKDQLDTLGKRHGAALARRQVMMHHLLSTKEPVSVLRLYDVSGGNAGDIKKMVDLGLVKIGEQEVLRDPIAEMPFTPSSPPELTQAQAEVWEQIRLGIQRVSKADSVKPFLLHGVTGSGKTEVYLHAVEEIIKQGNQAIVLVPEIALTPQTVQRFVARFPDKVGLVHSKLSPGERYDTWRRARAGEISVVVGPRSALFTPFNRLGLIILDECHDSSYYQADQSPSYHAREISTIYARLVGAICLLGSATPDVTSKYRTLQGEWTGLSLPARILAHREAVQFQMEKLTSATSRYRPLELDAQSIDLPTVQIEDMRASLKAGNRSIFSQALQTALREVLDRGQQAILFLNRRGAATYIFCRTCGYALKCPQCDTPLTMHKSPAGMQTAHELLCHRCNYKRRVPTTCPKCNSNQIKHYGTGTESVETEVRQAFPSAKTLRWDWSTTRKKGSHEAILRKFSQHHADFLIGTQMLAKGLDLPLVTLVGVILADVGLNLPDYRASERVFQVLTQVAGRAGRSPLGGKVVLQTFNPDHYVIQTAAGHNYDEFYRQEIINRREFGYPPFARLVRLEFRGTDNSAVENSARALKSEMQRWINAGAYQGIEIIGPTPCFFARIAGAFRWQLILRGPNPALVLKGKPLPDCRIEIDPPSLL